MFPRICKLNVLLILHGFGRKSTVTILVCYYPSASLMVGNFTQRSLTKLVKQSFDICVSMWWWWSIYNCPTWMFFIGKFSNHPCFAFTAASPLKIRIMKFIISTVKLNDSAYIYRVTGWAVRTNHASFWGSKTFLLFRVSWVLHFLLLYPMWWIKSHHNEKT